MTALVLDAHLKSSLAAIRSLGQKGVPVIAGSHRPLGMGLYSRYASAHFVYPSPLHDRAGFIEAVRRCAPDGTVVLPFGDSTLLPLVYEAGFLGGRYLYPVPACRDRFDIAFDKARTMRLARAIGVEFPVTHVCDDEAGFESVLSRVTYPAVIKPRRSVQWKANAGVHSGAAFAFTPEELRRQFFGALQRSEEARLIQEYVRGEEAAVEFLCDRGEIAAAFAHRRIRSWPPAGGPGAVKESVSLSYHGIGERAARLARELEWHGPMMVEFKIDHKTGIPKLIEINGRFWGSLPLAVASGVDFPYLCYRLALGETLEPALSYQEGVITRHWQADFKSLLYVLFKHDALRPYAYPRRIQALRQFLRHHRPDVADRRDMKPAAMELLETASRLIARIVRSCRRRPNSAAALAAREPAEPPALRGNGAL